jgi:DNA repair exonuclease SbcCD nuclease subunit
MTIRILHTADVHLDAPFHFLGHMGATHRHNIRETIGRILIMAAEGQYDLLLIAGDLFNDNHPSRDTQHFIASKLRELPLPVCILPGNHDPLERNSVYHKLELPPNVHLLKERPTHLDFPEIDLTVAGNPILSRNDNAPQLQNIARNGSARWFVAIAHGNMQVAGMFENGSRPIDPAAIAATNADYVALGDWHAFADYSQGRVKAYYSGAPEPTTLSQEKTGKVASITLSDQGITVEPIQVGTVDARKFDLSITDLTEHDVVQAIRAQADANCMMSIRLCGVKSAARLLDLESIYEAVSGQFYWLIIDDRAMLSVSQLDPNEYPEDFVIGQYARLLAAHIEQATNERERRVAEQALQLGIALLNGHKVL